MSNQLVITSGAKVRSLNGVITGTTGVLDSLPINGANGIPQLDSSGKILVSQLPNSVMEYQGTWNANTNTPTLTNGGAFNQGDVYLCNVAGTTDFGAGPISFVVGDQVIYSGSIWQKASGATGTVTSVAVTESGDALSITGSPITTSGTINIGFAGTSAQYVAGNGALVTFPTLITSIGLTMPSAFTVSNSPLTENGTIAVTGAGFPSQYIRGDGTLADFPTSGGGGSSVSYYLNGGTNQGTISGTTYYEMSRTADTGTGVDFAKIGDGLIVSFLTDVNDPAQLNIPGGNWNYEIYASMSSNGGTPQLYAELYKYDGTTFTLISTSSNEILYDGVNLNLYSFAMTVPSTTLAITDRLAIKLYATNSGGKTTTVHTQDSHLCQIITTFSTGITALNGLTTQVQYFATGTSGTDFNISSSTATHTFNLPTASATNRGALSSADWTTFNSKQGAITLTTTGSSGASTFVSNTLNVPTYTLAGLGGVPYTGATGNVTLGAYKLTATNLEVLGANASIKATDTGASLGIGVAANSGAISIASNGNVYLNSDVYLDTGYIGSGGGMLKYSSIGKLTKAVAGTDYQVPITLTTTGTSGAATFSSGTLNIPQYQAALTNPVTGTGTTNYVAKWSSSSAVTSSVIYDNGTNIGIGTTTPGSLLTVNGDVSIGYNNSLILGASPYRYKIYRSNSGSLETYFDDEYDISSTALNFRFRTSGTPITALRIVSTGAATFSSSVTATQAILTNGGLGLRIYNSGGSSSTNDAFIGADATYIYIGNYANNRGLFINNSTGASIFQGGNVGIGTSSPNTYPNYTNLQVNGTTAGMVQVSGSSSTLASFYAGSGIGQIGTTSNHPFMFFTNDVERMRITSGGALLVGKTSKSSFTGSTPIEVSGELASFGSLAGVFFENRASAGTMYGWYGNGSGIYLYNQTYGNIGVFGLSTGVYTPLSDVNKKKDFEDSTIGLNAILGLKPTLYRMKSDDSEGNKELGFIAQEVKDFIPQAYVEQDEFIGLNQMPIIAALVKSIQELKAEIDQLKNK